MKETSDLQQQQIVASPQPQTKFLAEIEGPSRMKSGRVPGTYLQYVTLWNHHKPANHPPVKMYRSNGMICRGLRVYQQPRGLATTGDSICGTPGIGYPED